jgi:zinc protease
MMRGRFLVPVCVAVVACGGATRPPAKAPPKPVPVTKETPVPSPDAWRNVRPGPGSLAVHAFPDVETARLDNGLTVYVVHKPAGVVSLSVVVRGGASRLPEGKSGLAALTVRMMTEGTKRRSALGLAEAVESMGTALEESAGRDLVRLGMTTLHEDMRRGLGLLSEVVREPAFLPAELERVRGEWLDSIEAERQSPARLSALVGLRLLLGPTRGAPVNGSKHDVEGLKRADLVRYYKDTFVPESAAVVVVGDVSLAEVKPVVGELFGTWRGTATTPAVASAEAPPPTAKKVVVVDRPGAVQSAIFIAQPFPRRAEPGHEARELLNTLVGGLFTSRLNANLREEHAFTYGANSLDLATREWGAFAVMTSVRTDVTGPALGEALSELEKAREPGRGRPITDAEVAVARVDLTQHLGAALADVAAVAGRVEGLFSDGLASDYLQKYPGMLDAVTTAAVATESQRLAPDRSIIVVVGDRDAIAEQLAARSFGVEIAPDTLTD